jgi:hypothetical protein
MTYQPVNPRYYIKSGDAYYISGTKHDTLDFSATYGPPVNDYLCATCYDKPAIAQRIISSNINFYTGNIDNLVKWPSEQRRALKQLKLWQSAQVVETV